MCIRDSLQAGPVSLPMTATEVVATLASPLNAFKIVNTGDPIGAFTEDRDSAIRGVLGAEPHMIPVHITVHESGVDRKVNVEVLDLPSLTTQAVLVSLYEALLESNQSTAETSYHLTGDVYKRQASNRLVSLNPGMRSELMASISCRLSVVKSVIICVFMSKVISAT